jgi:outer membrane protein
MRKKVIIILLAGAFVGAANAQDQEKWTLEECISFAVENNITLKRKELETEVSRKDFTQSKLNALPDLGGMVEHNLGSGRVLDRGTYEWVNTDVSQGDLGVRSNMTLFEGLTGWNTIRMEKAGYLMAKADYDILRNNITLQVMTGYLDLLRKTELYEIALDKVKVTELQVTRMQRLVDVGNASTGELLEVKSQHSNEKYNLTLARNSMDVAQLNLRHLMNLESDVPFVIERPVISDPDLLPLPDMETVYEKALGVLPRIESANQNIEYNKKNLAVRRGQLYPEVYLRGLYYSNYSDKLINPREADPLDPVLDYPVHLQVRDNQYRQVSLGVNIPIFNKWYTRTEISKAKVGLQDAEYQLEDTRLELMKEIQQYYTDARAALDNYHAAAENFANSDEAFRYTEEKFKVGMATALELEEARNRKYQSQSEMISSRYAFIFYLKILDFYQGSGIVLD